MTCIVRWIGCCLGLVCLSVPTLAMEKGPRQAAEALVESLANPQTPEAKRAEIRQSLLAHEIDAIPVLIEHLRDQRVGGLQPATLPGECISAPAHKPLPKRCAEALTGRNTMTVSAIAEDLLYQLLIEDYQSPLAAKGKPDVRQPFVVRDWSAWWRRRKEKSLDALHAEAQLLIDEFWRRGGDQGPLEWK